MYCFAVFNRPIDNVVFSFLLVLIIGVCVTRKFIVSLFFCYAPTELKAHISNTSSKDHIE